MDKLSLYEMLSFVLPGFIVFKIIEFYNFHIFKNETFFDDENKIEDSVLLFCVSLFLGIVIHILTFRLLKTSRLKWFKKLIFKTVHDLSIDNGLIQKTIPFLNKEYIRLREHQEEKVNENQIENNLFDFAYIYLEVNDKIAASKSFQSLYFMFRNVFTILLLLLPISTIILISTWLNDYNELQIKSQIILIAITIIIALIIIPTANWLREKLVEKVLWSYFVERIHENEKNNKTN
jgi:hypothetical protein